MSSTIARIIFRRFSASSCSLARELQLGDLRDAGHDVRHVLAEVFGDGLDRGQRVLDDVVKKPGDDARGIELEVGQHVGDLDRMDEIRLARAAHLRSVLPRREDVRAPEQIEVGLRVVALDAIEDLLESADHPLVLPKGGIIGSRDQAFPARTFLATAFGEGSAVFFFGSLSSHSCHTTRNGEAM